MADLFSVTAPLMIRCPDGEKRVMAEVFRHPKGLLYFDLFWDQLPRGSGIHVVTGEVRGDGPWKAGDCVVTLLGCQGSEPGLASEYAEWRWYLEQQAAAYPSPGELQEIARGYGALTC
jgi:hypothetical protein